MVLLWYDMFTLLEDGYNMICPLRMIQVCFGVFFSSMLMMVYAADLFRCLPNLKILKDISLKIDVYAFI